MIRTAVDSSVLLDVFAADPEYGEKSAMALQQCLAEGRIVACDVVWAELRPRFLEAQELLEAAAMIELGFDALDLEAALKAGEIWRDYREAGGRRERMIPDFLIGAHAVLRADRLLTRDRGFYRDYFKDLDILEP